MDGELVHERGPDGTFDPVGKAMAYNFVGAIIAHSAADRADEVVAAEVRPDLVREASVGDQHPPVGPPRLLSRMRRRRGMPHL